MTSRATLKRKKGANATMPTSTTKLIRAVLQKTRAATRARAKRQRSNQEDAPLKPLPVAKTNITPEERVRLADPNFVTEDEADVIICERRLREGGRLISLPQLLKRYGRKPGAPVAH